ncbi:tetratricopeptide repeat protein [Desulfurobacterium atlanticum]|uniref:Tetratricopeptide repeat-containing protein n=1 Tax=Desulfurobacterium atlanticum TaxID=240169 RepID=A0A238XVB4_9BACT|nr:hypothetical protein [Desulfurobacterium atlanticum]SNR62630.1 hypothetical protein SAMN06265340_101283 [Desulfurobacterium atlanticum]
MNSLNLFFLLLIHTLISLILAIFTVILLLKKIERKNSFEVLKNIFILFVLIFLIPVGGYFIIPFYFLILFPKKGISLPNYSELPIKDITMEKIKAKPRKFGEAALIQFVKQKKLTNENFMLVISKFIHPLTVKAMKKAFASTNDEVRLYAFAVISKYENEINEKIEMLKQKLEKVKTEEEKGDIYYELANLYWDMYYLGIIDKELENFVLKETEFYIEKALEITDNPEICFLAGKIYLKKSQMELAEKFLEEAFRKGSKNLKSKVAPYLAEIYFKKKNFSKVKKLFSIVELPLQPDVCFMKKFWSGDTQ